MPKNLTLILAVLAIGAAVAATYLASPKVLEDDFDTGTPLLPGFAARIPQIQRVEIIRDGETRVDVRRDEESGWVLDSMHGFPANFETLDELVSGLAEAHVESAKTAKPERYAQLGLDESNGAVRVRVSATDETLAEVVLGDSAGSGLSQYMLRNEDPTSWQINAVLDAPTDASSWIQPDILDIDAQRVQRVFFHEGSTLSRADASAPMKLVPMPEGKKISYTRALDHYAMGLGGVRIVSALPAEDITASIVQSTIEFATFDHLIVRGEQYLQDGSLLWRLTFSVSDALDAETQPEAHQLRAEEAEALNAMHARWGYELDNNSARQWELSLSGALTEIEPEEEEGEQ